MASDDAQAGLTQQTCRLPPKDMCRFEAPHRAQTSKRHTTTRLLRCNPKGQGRLG